MLIALQKKPDTLGIDPTPDGPCLVARVSVYRSVQFGVNLGPMPLDVPLLKERLPAVIVTPLEGGGDVLLGRARHGLGHPRRATQ